MTLTEDTLRFIREHRHDDVRSLALQAARYPLVDMPAALTQIAGRQAAEEKIPAWAATDGILYPPRLSMEQCSSEAAARYKAFVIEAVEGGDGQFVDLTGGFGVDCAFLSPLFARAVYVERQEALCEAARHNFPLLGLGHISVCHADSVRYLQEMNPVDCIYLDPARRDGHGRKTVAIGDCAPDVAALEDLLLRKARHVLIKLSPMLDLTLAMNDLKHVRQAHIVSVGNECRELLLLLGQGEGVPTDDIPIRCVNFTSAPAPQTFVFTRRQEKECACSYTPQPESYLYEPNTSVLKAGAFRSLSLLYRVAKLHPNSHLYTSATPLPGFPGRMFCVETWCGFGGKEVKGLLDGSRRANLTVRNFPSTVAALRKRLGLAEGGDIYLFATTLADGKKALIRCHTASPSDK